MKLILRYLKPFVLMLAVSIALLFVQVMCDLRLPGILSEMVDEGIQAGGIKPGAPEAISTEGMALLQTLLNEEDADTLEAGYELTASDSSIAVPIAARLSAAQSAPIYVRGHQDSVNTNNVDNAYARAATGLALAVNRLADETADGMASTSLEQLYEWIPLLEQRKASGELESYRSEAADEATTAGKQYETVLTRLFYSELGVDLEKLQHDYIVRTGVRMLAVALLGGIASVLVGWFASRIGTSVAMRLRRDVFEKVGRFSHAEYDRFSTASLITRTTNDVQQIQQLILMGIRLLVFAPVMGIGGIILAIRSSASLSWIIAVAVAAIVGIILVMFALAVPKFKKLQQLIDKLNLISRENLTGIMVIRAFRNEQFEERRLERANDELRRTNRFIQRTMTFLFPAMTLVMNMVSLLIIWVGAQAISNSELQIGSMMAFMQYAMQIIMSFLFMSMMFVAVPRALASSERIREVLDAEPTVQEPMNPESLSIEEGVTVEFDHVSFRYGSAEDAVLEDISFTAKPGETTAIIGTTGSGKSTLVSLIPRFHDATTGRVTLNGVDIRELSLETLRENIGYVPQKASLFSGDIASNISYGSRAAEVADIRQALATAQASEFVDRMADGLASPVAQGGSNYSGGQKQRLSIARALLRKPPLYIFDDSFSALDLKTDAALRKALATYTAKVVVIVVAQRVSTIKHAEQIIVLDKGRIVGQGTHDELMERCDTYRDIAESQLTKEELA